MVEHGAVYCRRVVLDSGRVIATMDERIEITLAADITIAHVGTLHEQLLECFHNPVDLVINANQVERVDSAALQCLYAFKRDLEKQGISIDWSSPSESFIRAIDLLGMQQLLESGTDLE